MRIAVLIIALCLAGLVGLQSLTVHVGGNLTSDQELSEGGAVGVLVALLYVLGAAFVMGLPRIAAGCFAGAAALAFIAAHQSAFEDMTIWAIGAVVLASMSWLGSKEPARGDAAGAKTLDRPTGAPTPIRANEPLPTTQVVRVQSTLDRSLGDRQKPDASAAGQARGDLIGAFERLDRLRSNGAISEMEFDQIKAHMLLVTRDRDAR